MRFRLAQSAKRDLDRIFVYQAEHGSLELADRLVDSITERMALLGDYPDLGRKSENVSPGILSFPAGDYIIFFRKKRVGIQIVHVIHGARDQSAALKPGSSR